MADVMMAGGLVVGISVLAAVLLGMRDARRGRRQRERRPVADRVASIRNDALFQIEQLQRVLEHQAVERPEAVHWIPPVLEYYRRLANLASDAETSAEDAIRLAEEASGYVRKHRLKGISIAEEARQLAELLAARNAD